MKIDRRMFWIRLLAPVAAFFGIKNFGNRYNNVLVPRCYMMAGPTIPGAKYDFKNPDLIKAAEALGKAAAERMDRNILEVLKNG